MRRRAACTTPSHLLEPFLKLRSTGRGTAFHPAYGVLESFLRYAYAFSWPAHAWSLVPGATRVRHLVHRLAILPSHHRGRTLRIGFASDLHVGPTTPKRTLEHARSILAGARLAALLLGGDYVFLEPSPLRMRALHAWVASIPAATKVAVMGNHDLWTEHAHIEDALERAGAKVLVNQSLRLPTPFDDVAIVGIDEPWTGRPDGPRALEGTGDASLRIALGHSPDAHPHIRDRGVSLLVCGHTHGGQLALPGERPIVVPGPNGRKFPHGMHRIDDLHLFVSRGLGGVEIPMRTYAPPDVAVFELVAPDDQ